MAPYRVKLNGSRVSFICEEEGSNREIPLLPNQEDWPLYEELEAKINDVLPAPLWMRNMGEAQEKGFKFQRGKNPDC